MDSVVVHPRPTFDDRLLRQWIGCHVRIDFGCNAETFHITAGNEIPAESKQSDAEACRYCADPPRARSNIT